MPFLERKGKYQTSFLVRYKLIHLERDRFILVNNDTSCFPFSVLDHQSTKYAKFGKFIIYIMVYALHARDIF